MEYIQSFGTLWEEPPTLKLIARSHWSSPHSSARHEHPFYELGLVLEGSLDWYIGPEKQQLTLSAGEAILLEPGVSHREGMETGAGAIVGWLGFDSSGTTPSWLRRRIPLGSDEGEIGQLFLTLVGEHHRKTPFTSARTRLAIQSLLLLVARQADKAERAQRPSKPGSHVSSPVAAREYKLNPRQIECVEAAAHYFRENLRSPLSIAQVAAYHSLCPAWFSTLFQRYHGQSPRAFLQRARLHRAAHCLLHTAQSLKEIASACGFVDAAHLCKAFKKAHSLTPSAYRARQ